MSSPSRDGQVEELVNEHLGDSLRTLTDALVELVRHVADEEYENGHIEGHEEGKEEGYEEARSKGVDAWQLSCEMQRIWRQYGPENERLCDWWRTFEEPWASIAKAMDIS